MVKYYTELPSPIVGLCHCYNHNEQHLVGQRRCNARVCLLSSLLCIHGPGKTLASRRIPYHTVPYCVWNHTEMFFIGQARESNLRWHHVKISQLSSITSSEKNWRLQLHVVCSDPPQEKGFLWCDRAVLNSCTVRNVWQTKKVSGFWSKVYGSVCSAATWLNKISLLSCTYTITLDLSCTYTASKTC